MHRHVLRYKGTGAIPNSDLQLIRNTSGVTVVDESPRMLLVEGDDERIAHLRDNLADWLVTPQGQIPLPDTRQRIKRSID